MNQLPIVDSPPTYLKGLSGQEGGLFKSSYYSCSLSTATIEYSCPSACLRACVSVSKNNGSVHLKLEHIVVFENSSDEFDIGHCPIKVKVMA